MNKKVTIQDIADALCISRNTVSKAINNADGLADFHQGKNPAKSRRDGLQAVFLRREHRHPQKQYTANRPGGSQWVPGRDCLLTGAFLTHSHFALLMLDKFQREISQLGYTMNNPRVTRKILCAKRLPITLHLEQVRGIVCIEMFDWGL